MIHAIQIYIDGNQIYPQPVDHSRLERLHSKGWTLRPAAARLGVHWTHLHYVLTGKRSSKSLTRRIEALPPSP